MRVAIVSMLVGACAAPSVTTSLEVPAVAAADLDLTCMQSVQVTAHGTAGDAERECIELGTPVRSFADLKRALVGRVALALPESDLAYIEVTGHASKACGDASPMLYGGGKAGELDDGVLVSIHGYHGCTRQTQDIRLVDLVSVLVGTTAAQRCQPLTSLPTAVGWTTLRPHLWGQSGDAQFAYEIKIANVEGLSCNGVGTTKDSPAQKDHNITCLDPISVCGGGLDFATIDPLLFQSSFGFSADLPMVLVGTIWDANKQQPIKNATVLLDGVGKVIYPAWAVTGFVQRSSAVTNEAGLFAVYLPRPTLATVSAPGYRTRTRVLSGSIGAIIFTLQPT